MRQQLLSPRFARDNAPAVQAMLAESQRCAIKDFQRRLTDGQYRLVGEPCPCGGADDCLVAEIDRYGLPLSTVLCGACGALRTNPYLDDASLDHFYRTTYQAMYARAPHLEQYFKNQFGYGVRIGALYERELPSRAGVLEIGCGAGGGLAAFQERGHDVAGCELSRDLIEFGVKQGVRNLWHGTIDEMPSALTSRRWHLIYLHHVFEHVQSPVATLQSLSRLLAPGGRILTIVPDITRIDQFANPGGNALAFFHVAHKFNFTIPNLQVVGSHAGLLAAATSPPSDLETVWSEMPELWMEFRQGAGCPLTPSSPPGEGDRILAYLLETERQFLAGRRVSPSLRTNSGVAAPQLHADSKRRGPMKRLMKWIRRRSTRAA